MPTCIRGLALAAVAALAFVACASGGPRSEAVVERAATTTSVSIPLLQPRPGLYSVGQPAQTDWPAIRALGVAIVINLRTAEEMQGRDEAAEVRAAGMAYHAIPIAGLEGIDRGKA